MACPNKNTPEFKKLVKQLGSEEAAIYTWKAWGEKYPPNNIFLTPNELSKQLEIPFNFEEDNEILEDDSLLDNAEYQRIDSTKPKPKPGLQDIKKSLKIRNRMSERSVRLMADRLYRYNVKNGTSHKYVAHRIGQEDSYNIELKLSYIPTVKARMMAQMFNKHPNWQKPQFMQSDVISPEDVVSRLEKDTKEAQDMLDNDGFYLDDNGDVRSTGERRYQLANEELIKYKAISNKFDQDISALNQYNIRSLNRQGKSDSTMSEVDKEYFKNSPFSGKYILSLGKPSSILRKLGVPNLEITVGSNWLLEHIIRNPEHNLKLSNLKGFVEAIQNPVAIIQDKEYKGQQGRIEFLTTIRSRDNKPTNVIIQLDRQFKDGSEVISVNNILTAFETDLFRFQKASRKDGILYIDKERITNYLQGVLLPSTLKNLTDQEGMLVYPKSISDSSTNLQKFLYSVDNFKNPLSESDRRYQQILAQKFNNPTPNISIEEGLKWARQVFSDDNIDIVSGLIDDIAKGSYDTATDLIQASKEYSDKGTIKHEIGHKIFSWLPRSKQDKILNAGAELFNLERGSEAKDIAIEEKIMDTLEKSPDSYLPGTVVGRFIQSIKNFLKDLFNKQDEVTKFVNDVNQGKYKNLTKPNNNEVRQDDYTSIYVEKPIRGVEKILPNKRKQGSDSWGNISELSRRRFNLSLPNSIDLSNIEKDSVLGIFYEWKQSNHSETIFKNYAILSDLKRRILSEDGLIGQLGKAVRERMDGIQIKVIQDPDENAPLGWVESGENGLPILYFNASGNSILGFMDKYDSDEERIVGIESLLSEELIHMIQHLITTKEERIAGWNELSTTQQNLIKSFYHRNISKDNRILSNQAYYLEFLRAKMQNDLYGYSSELATLYASSITESLLRRLYNYILNVFKKLPKDSITNQLHQRTLDAINKYSNPLQETKEINENTRSISKLYSRARSNTEQDSKLLQNKERSGEFSNSSNSKDSFIGKLSRRDYPGLPKILPNSERYDNESIMGIFRRWKESDRSETFFDNFQLLNAIKKRILSGSGLIGELAKVASGSMGTEEPNIVIKQMYKNPSIIYVENKTIYINSEYNLLDILDKIGNDNDRIIFLEMMMSEELIHLINHNNISREERIQGWNELSPSQQQMVKNFYHKQKNVPDNIKLTNGAYYLEFIRAKVQEQLYGISSELSNIKSSTFTKSVLRRLYNYILNLFNRLPKDSITNQVYERTINAIKDLDNSTNINTNTENLVTPFAVTNSGSTTNNTSNTGNTSTPYDSILQQRKDTLEFQSRSYKLETDPAKRAIIKDRMERLREDIAQLKDTDSRSFEYLIATGLADLDAINRGLDGGIKDADTLTYFLSLLNGYPDFIEKGFKSVIDNLEKDKLAEYDHFTNSVKRVTERINLRLFKEADELSKKYGGASVINIDGTLIDVPDINNIQQGVLSASEVQHPLVKGINKIIQNTLDTINIKFGIFKKAHDKIVKNFVEYQKKNGFTKENMYNFALQTDAKGKKTGFVVGKYTYEYFQKRADAKANKYDRLRFFADSHKSFKVNEDAWKQRYEREKEQFFNEPDRDENNEQDVNDFNKYIDAMNPHSMMRVLESAKKGKISATNANFLQYYSRNGYFSPEVIKGEVVFPLEMEAVEEYLDPKYKIIENMSDTDPRKIFYNHYIEHSRDSRKRMSSAEFYTSWNEIPEMTKTSNISSRVKDWSQRLISENTSLNVRIKNPATGEYSLSIPTFMTNKKGIPVEDRSFDLGTILDKFVSESYRFSEVNEVKDDVDLMLEALRNVKTFRTNVFGKPVLDKNKEKIYKEDTSNLYKLIRYTIDSKLYGEDRVPEFATSIKVTSQETKKTLKGLEEQMNALGLSEQDRDAARLIINTDGSYNGKDPKISKFVELGKQYKQLSNTTRVVTGSAFGNSLIKATQLRFLGFNMFAQFGELLQGLYSLSLTSAGGRWFSAKQATDAAGKVMKSTNPFTNKESNKIRKLSDFFESNKESVFGELGSGNKIIDTAFLGYKGAAYLINNTYLVAYLMNQKVTDNKGNVHSLFDVIDIDKDGIPTIQGDFDKNYFIDENNNPTENLLKIRQEYRKIIRDNRDRKNQYDPIVLNKTFLGRAAGQFKSSWMISAFMLRLGPTQLDFNGNEVEKGFYRTFGDLFRLPETIDVLGNTIKDRSPKGVLKAIQGALSEMCKYGWVGKLTGKKGTSVLSDIDQRNMKMFIRELTWTLFVATTIVVLTGLAKSDPDDDDKNKYYYFINQATRLLRDLTAFSDPNSLVSFTKNPLPIMSTVSDSFTFLGSLASSGLAATPGYTLEQFHIGKKFISLVPGVRQVPSTINKFSKLVHYQ